jgi:hypothetical protein
MPTWVDPAVDIASLDTTILYNYPLHEMNEKQKARAERRFA